MEAGYQVEQGILRIYVPEELDHHIAEKIREESETIMQQRQIRQVIFDFSNTTFMDSSGIGMIIGRVKRMRGVNGEVIACHVTPQIHRILCMSKMQDVISIHREEEEWKN